MNIEEIKHFLRCYDGPEMNIMEVCGSHTGAIARYGIPSLLSPKLHLLSGPGCPVCVTPTAYIDRLIDLSRQKKTCIVTFGDLIRVPGSKMSLAKAKGDGAQVEMVYSPFDVLSLAEKNPDTTFVFAAIGFETTTPVYAMLMDTITENLPQKRYQNIRLLTSIKTMPEVIQHLLEGGAPIDGFLAPGHVSVVTGSKIFEPAAQKYGIPFGISGFSAEELLVSLYGIIRHYKKGVVKNYYPSVVTEQGNQKALELIQKYFERSDAVWRGMGTVAQSGRLLRQEYCQYDAGSKGLDLDVPLHPGCHCSQILMGKIKPPKCPLFGTICTPMNPQGACMVSEEGSCFSYFVNKRKE